MSSSSRMLSGSPFLIGDNPVPGVPIHPEVKEQLPRVFKACKDFGLDFYKTRIEFCTYDDISEIASYGGFPVRYPHWQFGMEYEEMSRGYEFGQYRISEMVVNTDPCIIYCLDSNTITNNINVIAHALGHNDFFKNNVFFRGTNTNMMEQFASHANRIRKYMARWGKERVIEFIDTVRAVETMIDAAKEWRPKPMPVIDHRDHREVIHPVRRDSTNEYMGDWVNPKDFLDKQKKDLHRMEIAKELEIFTGVEKDVFGYLKDHAPLRPWQKDIIAMLYEEAIYFAPQRLTKMINEGWASYVDMNIMCREGLVSAGLETNDAGIIEYAHHKMLVLGGQWSQNPYKLGFEILMDIEERWNKGKFGTEWDECTDIVQREKWDKKLGQGKDKVFQVREYCNDFTLIAEYFTPELCSKLKYYEAQKMPARDRRKGEWEWRIMSRDFKKMKHNLMRRYANGGLPDLRLVDPNHKGKGILLLQHHTDGRELYEKWTRHVMTSLYKLWQNDVVIATKNDEDEETFYVCAGGKSPKDDVRIMSRAEYEKLGN